MLTQAIRKIERRAESVNLGHPRDPALMRVFGLTPSTASGVGISEDNASNLAAVYCAVRCISETAAGLPLYAYTRQGEDRQRQKDHPASVVLHNPNPNVTRFTWRVTALADCLLWGNFYAEIVYGGGVPVQLWRFHPSQVEVIDQGRRGMSYKVREENQPERVIAPRNMIHVPSPMDGRSVIGFARESLGLSVAAERMGANVFGNGGRVGGVLTLTRPATRERKIEIADEWTREFGGPNNQGKIAVLDPDSTYTQIGIPPEDAQFLETRAFQVQEVARWFRLSPTKLMDFTHATFSNIEEVNRQFASESILPWTKRFDQEFDRRLLTERERQTLFIEHDLGGLLEGDIESQGQFWSLGRQWGWISTNEIRRKLNLNGIGPEGDIYLQPMNMVEAGTPPDDPEPTAVVDPPDAEDDDPPAGDDGDAVRRLTEELAELRQMVGQYTAEQQVAQVISVLERFAHKERREVLAIAGKPAMFDKLEQFYIRHARKMSGALESVGHRNLESVFARCDRHREAIIAATECQPEELASRIADALDELDAARVDFARSLVDDTRNTRAAGAGAAQQ